MKWVDSDYERLYDYLRETKRKVVCKVEYPWVEGDSVTDIARIHPTTLEIQARGISYNSPRQLEKEDFVRMCEESCVVWLDESPSPDNQEELWREVFVAVGADKEWGKCLTEMKSKYTITKKQ